LTETSAQSENYPLKKGKYMSAIAYVGVNSRPDLMQVGDSLLEPLRFCGRQWKAITEPLEEVDVLWKAAQVAWKTILAIAMAIVTKLAFIPGMIGAVIKSYNSHTDVIECNVDDLTRNNLMELRIQDTSVRDSIIARQIRHHLNLSENREVGLFSSLNVTRQSHTFTGGGTNVPVTSVNVTPQATTVRIVDHIIDCFKEAGPADEDGKKKALMELSDMVLGVERQISDPSQAPVLVVPQDYSRICLTYANDFSKMRVEAFS